MTNSEKVKEFVSNLFEQFGLDELENTLDTRLASEFTFETKVEWSETPSPTIYVMEDSEDGNITMNVLTMVS
jgi:hypothetical protein